MGVLPSLKFPNQFPKTLAGTVKNSIKMNIAELQVFANDFLVMLYHNFS